MRTVGVGGRAGRRRRARLSLLDVVARVAPHALVGVTGQPGLFTEAVIRAQAADGRSADRAAAVEPDAACRVHSGRRAGVDRWPGAGRHRQSVPRGQVGTQSHPITQVNNLYLFPGLGRGVVAVGATQGQRLDAQRSGDRHRLDRTARCQQRR